MPVQAATWVAADGVKIVGDVAGDSESAAVILLHGGGQTRHSWSAAVHRLIRAGYYVINYDLRGHGQSGWSANRKYFTAMQAVAEGLRPAALVLVDIILRPEREGVERICKFMLGNPSGFATLDDAADAVAAYNPQRRRPGNPSGLLKNLRLGADGRYFWHWDPFVISQEPDEELQDMTQSVDGMRAASSIPALLVRGARSDVVSDSSVEDHSGKSCPTWKLLVWTEQGIWWPVTAMMLSTEPSWISVASISARRPALIDASLIAGFAQVVTRVLAVRQAKKTVPLRFIKLRAIVELLEPSVEL